MSAATGYEGVLQEPSLQYKLGEERIELAMKIEKLKSFMTVSPKYQELSYNHQRLLQDQLLAMNSYEGALIDRLILLNQPNEN